MSVPDLSRKIPVTRLLTVRQVDELAQLAKESGRPESEILREAVDSFLTAIAQRAE